MQIIDRIDPLRREIEARRRDGPLALVPTMGALHEGHLTLVREAAKRSAHVSVSIFVNPLQFGAGEDLESYPRRLERDCELLSGEGVSLVWAPRLEEMYPPGYATNISVSGVSEGLCGADRPGHFDGVATVVCKLFQQVGPDLALFGEKDWQQLAVIRRMARDLDFTRPHADRIIAVPTVREADGLAMSSRNAYLSKEERSRAAIARIEAGEAVEATLADLRQVLLGGGFASVDYAELRDSDTLAPLGAVGEASARLLVAARIGKARLIDNMSVGREKGYSR
jgi:pantoate--beta-alanine ligase